MRVRQQILLQDGTYSTELITQQHIQLIALAMGVSKLMLINNLTILFTIQTFNTRLLMKFKRTSLSQLTQLCY